MDVPGCTPDCATQMIGEDDGCGGVCTGGGFGIGLKPGGAQDVGYFRHLVDEGEVPEAALFPIEGFLNEHDTALPAPDFDMFATLHAFLGMLYDPQADKPLIAMQIGLNSAVSPEAIESKHFNLVVVVDKSGSMGSAGKLDFVKAGLLLMLNTLDEDDTLAIVTYSDNAEVACGPTPVAGYNKGHLVDVITGIQASGSTNLYAGMVEGYELAKMNINKPNTISRILLLSDGLISAGEHNFDVILAKSAQYNEAGIGITTVGVGTEFNQNLMYQLASQGNGNFYFLEDGEKLVDVFDYELVYLLTPVAENLKISFRLPEGFFVEEIYGFDFQELDDGEIVLLGPAPQYSVTPPDQGGGDNPDPDAGNVAIPTLFASKKNGILMVRLGVQQTSIFDAWEALDFAEITYSYDLADTGETESATKTVVMGSLSYFEEDDPDSELAFFTGPIMQRNFCILRMALGVKEACALYHNIPQDVGGAIIQLADAMTFCKGINFTLNDSVIDEDIELLEALKDNICAGADCMPSQ